MDRTAGNKLRFTRAAVRVQAVYFLLHTFRSGRRPFTVNTPFRRAFSLMLMSSLYGQPYGKTCASARAAKTRHHHCRTSSP